jgi:hypothetical protein
MRGAGRGTTGGLLVHRRNKRVAVEHVLRSCGVFCSSPGRARHRVPLERIQRRGRGSGLEDARAEGVIAIRGGRALQAEGNKTVSVVIHIRGGRAIHRLLTDVSIVVVGERRRGAPRGYLRHRIGVGVAHRGVGVAHEAIVSANCARFARFGIPSAIRVRAIAIAHALSDAFNQGEPQLVSMIGAVLLRPQPRPTNCPEDDHSWDSRIKSGSGSSEC